MATYRAYLDKKIDPKTRQGGDHSRSLDLEAESLNAARKQAEKELKKDEVVNSVVETR